jgi:hypothetical protein
MGMVAIRFLALCGAFVVALGALLLLVWVVGLAIPRIDSGVNRFPSGKKELARAAYERADLYSVGSDGLFVSGLTVKSVRECPNVSRKPTTPASRDTSRLQGVIADVDMYTFFGLPYGTIRVRCDGASLTRNF